MDIIKSPLQGCYLLNERVIEDNRGYFLETYNYDFIKEKINLDHFVQENESFSFKKVPQEVLDSIQTENYIWKYGDTYWSLASKYYADSKMWWIIASYNRKPTEALLKIGDTIKIPLSIAEVMRVL